RWLARASHLPRTNWQYRGRADRGRAARRKLTRVLWGQPVTWATYRTLLNAVGGEPPQSSQNMAGEVDDGVDFQHVLHPRLARTIKFVPMTELRAAGLWRQPRKAVDAIALRVLWMDICHRLPGPAEWDRVHAASSAGRKADSGAKPCRPVSLTPCRRRSSATSPISSRCSSSHCDIPFSSRPISCSAKRSNMLAWTVRSYALSAPAVAVLLVESVA